MVLPTRLRVWLVRDLYMRGKYQYTMLCSDEVSSAEYEPTSIFDDPRGHNTPVMHCQIKEVHPKGSGSTVSSSAGPVMSEHWSGGQFQSNNRSQAFKRDGVYYFVEAWIEHRVGNNYCYYCYSIYSFKLYMFTTPEASGSGWNAPYHWRNTGDVGDHWSPCAWDADVNAYDIDPWWNTVVAMASQVCPPDRFYQYQGYCDYYYDPEYNLPESAIGGFLLNEPSWFKGRSDLHPFIKDLQEIAFTKAVEEFPRYNENNIANVMEIIDIAKLFLFSDPSVLEDFLKKLSQRSPNKALADAWMTYRYVYTTTKLDTRQALDACARKHILYMQPLHFNGKASGVIPGSDVKVDVRVGFDVRQQTSDMLRTIQHALYMRGFEVNEYVIWDLIPFSFIVDWFYGIGNLAETKVISDHLSDYIFDSICNSVSYTWDDEGVVYKAYTRWYSGVPGVKLEYSHPSARTWLKRAGDVVAMLST